MMKHKIAFFDTKEYDKNFFNEYNKDKAYEIKYFNTKLNSQTAQLSHGFDVVCAFVNDILDKETIDILHKNNVKLIALRCAGYNNVDLKQVYKKINVVRVPAYSPYAVAEHAISLMMCLNRKIHKSYYRTRDNNFSINGLMGFDMHGKTVGVIGAGRIGQVIINILKGFGTRVIVYDKYFDTKKAKENDIKLVEIDQIYSESDIISLHCPLNKQTYHMIDKESLKKMKSSVMLINTSRGKLINTKDLIWALKHGKISSAGLDVYEEESQYFFEDYSNSFISDDMLSRLLSFNNVIVTSHQGFFTKEALSSIASQTLANIDDFFNGKALKNEVCYRCESPECIRAKKGRCF